MNKKRIISISTIDRKAGRLAREYGLGVEIAQFCTAYNMDIDYEKYDREVRNDIEGIKEKTLHGPFNELFPCAIDPKARELAAYRYRQAALLAHEYGAKKVVIHGGYNPYLYYEEYFTEQSILFWKKFMDEMDADHKLNDMEIVLENVLEPEPEMLCGIVKTVDHPKLRLCLDTGHVNAYSGTEWNQWIETCGRYLSHVHLHNNNGERDTHSALTDGTLPMTEVLEMLDRTAPDATICLELPDAEESVIWLQKNYARF